MATLNKIIKLTQEQYNTLASGGTVGEYTGIDESYLYLVQSEKNYVDLTSDQNIQGIKTFRDGIKLEMAPDIIIGGDQFGNEIICVSQNSNVLTSENNVFINITNEQLKIYNLIDPQNEDDAATKKYVDDKFSSISSGTKLYKHTITTSTTTDQAVIIISENADNVSGSTPANFVSMPFISGYITLYPIADSAPKHPILYKTGVTIGYYDPAAETIVSLSVTGTITDTVTPL